MLHRIKIRVSLGGHNIPEQDVIRRFYRSKANFWNVYKNLVDSWVIFCNSSSEEPQRVATGKQTQHIIELEHLFDIFSQNISV